MVILFLPGFVLVDKGVYYLEKDNKFCVACHLHEKKYNDFVSKNSTIINLAARHYAAGAGGGKCIDCHGGEGVAERAVVLAVAGFDTLKFVFGNPSEPDKMNFPLSDRSCLKCHHKDMVSNGSYSDKYHEHTAHANLETGCSRCHSPHKKGDPELAYLVEKDVIPVCRECHAGMF